MSKTQKIDDKFAHSVLSLEEAIFEIDDLLENHTFTKNELEDLISVKELAESARDLFVCVIASVSGKSKKT